MRRALALTLLLIAPVAGAQDAGTGPEAVAPRFEQAFETWLDSVGAAQGILALRYEGAPVATWSRGRNADDIVDLASLSKAITGVCAADLVDDGALYYDNSAREILGLPGAAPVTIGALLSHATGLEKDHTQVPMSWWKDDPTPRWAEVTPNALSPDRITGDGRYYYSNENYAVLGTVIEEVTGQDYEEACRQRVLEPGGVTGKASQRFAAYLPWGGWAMSMADYAAFVDYAYAPGGLLGDRLAELPDVVIDGPVHYGMGMLQREMEGGSRNVWHFGALCFNDGPNFGTYAVHWNTGWTLTAWYDACLTETEMAALDTAMVRASYGLD